MTTNIHDERKVEGFGDPQYTCGDRELAIRRTIYIFFQQQSAVNTLRQHMTQDWAGNTLTINGSFRPADLAKAIENAIDSLASTTST
jgi:hypothetical protein